MRYCVRKNKQGVFHLRWNREIGDYYPLIFWDQDDYNLTCWARDNPYVREMSRTIAYTQRQEQGSSGGRFIIDEYGRVIIPNYRANPMSVGTVDCRNIIFNNPLTNLPIDLSNDTGLMLGDVWDRPYIGVVYRFGTDHRIRFENNYRIEFPTHQDQQLIERLRSLRPRGGQFLVNPHGIVITQIEKGSGYVPTYVGRINKQYWFS